MKKKERKMKKSKSLTFDNSVSHDFKVDVKLGPGKTETIEFSVKTKNSECLSYDEVEFAAYDKKEIEFPEAYFPKAEINGRIFIKNDGGKWCPVLSESDKSGISDLRNSKEYDMFLVLPDATYSLTPEYSLYKKMVENGAIDPDIFEYDYDKMHSILESANVDNFKKGKTLKHK